MLCLTFGKNNIEGIEFFYISTKEVSETIHFLKIQFLNAFTIPGTRSFHQFSHLDNLRIAAKRCSEDEEISLVHNFDTNATETEIDVSPRVCLLSV